MCRCFGWALRWYKVDLACSQNGFGRPFFMPWNQTNDSPPFFSMTPFQARGMFFIFWFVDVLHKTRSCNRMQLCFPIRPSASDQISIRFFRLLIEKREFESPAAAAQIMALRADFGCPHLSVLDEAIGRFFIPGNLRTDQDCSLNVYGCFTKRTAES